MIQSVEFEARECPNRHISEEFTEKIWESCGLLCVHVWP
jgi:hypothetical protein